MTEQTTLALIGMFGGAGGLVTMAKAFLDFREHRLARVDDADERLVSRLERKLAEADARIATLELQHEQDSAYITALSIAMAKAGIEVPSR